MAKGQKHPAREVQKPKKTSAERSAARIENSVSATFLKAKTFGKRKP